MSRTRLYWLVLLFAFLVGVLLRLWRFTEIPSGLNRDEVSVAYNAYSILKTGRDEHSRSYPLHFQSFGDWKLPGYIYLEIPFIAWLGLSEYTVRLPSVLAGLFSIILVGYLIFLLFGEEQASWVKLMGVIGALLMTFNPWHFHFSRVGYEANLALFFFLMGLVLLLGMKKNSKLRVILGSISFGLTLFTYHASHLFIPVFLPVLGWWLVKKKKWLFKPPFHFWFLISLGLFLTFLVVAAASSFAGPERVKLSGLHLFGDPGQLYKEIDLKRADHSGFLAGALLHNKFTFGLRQFGLNFLKSFSPEFLYERGGTNRTHNIAGFGNFYLAEAIFFLAGFLWLAKKGGTTAGFLLFWLVLGVLPSAVTKDAPHTARTIFALPAFMVIEAAGVVDIYAALRRCRTKLACLGVLTVIAVYVIGAALFFDGYFVHFKIREAKNWGYGYKRLWEYIETNGPFTEVIFDRPDCSPYIFLLFESRYSPANFQAEVEYYPASKEGYLHVRNFSNFEFVENLVWDGSAYPDQSLMVRRAIGEFAGVHEKGTDLIRDPVGEPIFVLKEVGKKIR
jgi:4-amino-4-deoxy-L-arabinose transferase-like glycosyltransferase